VNSCFQRFWFPNETILLLYLFDVVVFILTLLRLSCAHLLAMTFVSIVLIVVGVVVWLRFGVYCV
jgi:hypothetical protein